MKVLLFLCLLISIASIHKAQTIDELECSKVTEQTERRIPYRIGKWTPHDHAILKKHLGRLLEEVESEPEPLLPVVQEFQDLIENDPVILMLFSSMFTEVPQTPPFDKDIHGDPQVRDYKAALQLINKVLRKAPGFDKITGVTVSVYTVFYWAMDTKSGFAAFLNEKVNAQLRKILNEWAKFLESPDSRTVLNEGPSGWLSEDAQKLTGSIADQFECDPTQEYYGFKSWDDFFVRKFRPGQRPLPPEDDSVIVNACESAPFRIARGVNKTDTFWIKAQPYSIMHMLAGDSLAEQFVGGTVYQAFLSLTSYHRWHSPVNGRVVKAYVVEGTYYSEPSYLGSNGSLKNAQAYIAEVATRALIFIEADNPDIGLMCVVLIGMAEVSSCDITVQEGQIVKKGDELGMFHYGGSSHCLVFRPEVNLEFDLRGQEPSTNATDIPINSKIATVRKA